MYVLWPKRLNQKTISNGTQYRFLVVLLCVITMATAIFYLNRDHRAEQETFQKHHVVLGRSLWSGHGYRDKAGSGIKSFTPTFLFASVYIVFNLLWVGALQYQPRHMTAAFLVAAYALLNEWLVADRSTQCARTTSSL
jgi:hypothetical protein